MRNKKVAVTTIVVVPVTYVVVGAITTVRSFRQRRRQGVPEGRAMDLAFDDGVAWPFEMAINRLDKIVKKLKKHHKSGLRAA